MSTKYKATMPGTGYFVTITTVGRVDVFTRLKQRYVIINALDYCQKHKGLEIYAYCIMPSHIHMLCKAKEGYILSNIMRDFK
jgi:REP element-mobilizing transposase RayT